MLSQLRDAVTSDICNPNVYVTAAAADQAINIERELGEVVTELLSIADELIQKSQGKQDKKGKHKISTVQW